MCLITFAFQLHPEYPLLLLANRDEFYRRPTQPAHWWRDAPGVFAGRDLTAGGSWMGVDRSGRFAALTNVREPHNIRENAPSRGDLVLDFLRVSHEPATYLNELAARGDAFNGFNLLVGDRAQIWYYGNRTGDAPRRLDAGIYGLSNATLDTPWPKVRRVKDALGSYLERPEPERGLKMLANRALAPDEELPQTGVPLEWERGLSAMFIELEGYGTRCSTVLHLRKDGAVHFVERSYAPDTGLIAAQFNK